MIISYGRSDKKNPNPYEQMVYNTDHINIGTINRQYMI